MNLQLHLTYGVPEPIDIHVGTERAAIHLSPMADEMGRHVIKIFDDTVGGDANYAGYVRLTPDRAAEAVQAETERCKAIIANDDGVLSAYAHARTRLIAAIDATPEPVSDFTRGGEAMRENLRSLMGAWGGPFTQAAAIKWMDGAAKVTEPTDAK